jgi:ubiquinone/menaquinone biosynthesis C-methylase UbiE
MHPPTNDLAFWDARYREQAGWTRGMRQDLLLRIDISRARRLLDVGCGTGALAGELIDACAGLVCELDRDMASLRFAERGARRGRRCQGLAEGLPFANAAFDVTLCHFLLLWVSSPRSVLSEMRRVTASGGAVIALAEPDYAGRIDWPAELETAGEHQARSLAHAGAHPSIGRQLRDMFHRAGLVRVRVSVLGGEWVDGPADTFSQETAVLARDLANSLSSAEIQDLLDKEAQAARDQSRVTFVPTFSAVGFVP